MKILLIGGYGNISWHCASLALELGHEVWILNRAATRNTRRPPPAGVREIHVDMRDAGAVIAALGRMEFDAVADFICFNADQAQADIDIFGNRTRQFIFVGSDVVYEKRAANLPFREDCPQVAPEISGEYVRGKALAEKAFLSAWKNDGFPATVVRPSYTYDTIFPVSLGHNCFTAPTRYLKGKPVLIAGDGNNIWSFTHSSDFARGFVGLLGNSAAIGESFHIATEEWLTWNEAIDIILDALGVRNPRIVHIPVEDVLRSEFGRQPDLMFSRIWHNIFNVDKIKKFVPGWRARTPFSRGIRRTLAWLYENDAHRRFDPNIDRMLEELTLRYG